MLYQTLSHTLKLAPHESPSSQPLTKNPQQLCYFYAKPSRKTLNKFGKPSTTLIIQSNFLYGEAGINPFDQHPLLNYTLQWSLPLFVVSFPYSVFFSLSYFSTFSFVPGTVTVHQSVSLMFFVTFSFVHPYD